MEKTIKVVVFGEFYVGKSQFCNFIKKDLTNSIYKVSVNCYSDTIEPQSITIERQRIRLELIDTPGKIWNEYEEKINKIIKFLKDKKEIDQILFLFRFDNLRLSNNESLILKKLSSIFTPFEFITHLIIIFTNYFQDEGEEYLYINQCFKPCIKEELNKIFSMNIGFTIPDIPIYYFNTRVIKKEDKLSFQKNSEIASNEFIEELKLRISSPFYSPIDTTKLDYNKDLIIQKIENEKNKILKEIENLKKDKEKRGKLIKDLEKEKQNYQTFINNIKSRQRDSISSGKISFGACLLEKVIEE